MSLSLMAFQPAIEEASNMMPSAKASSSMSEHVHGDVLHLAARIGESQIDEFHVLFLEQAECRLDGS